MHHHIMYQWRAVSERFCKLITYGVQLVDSDIYYYITDWVNFLVAAYLSMLALKHYCL